MAGGLRVWLGRSGVLGILAWRRTTPSGVAFLIDRTRDAMLGIQVEVLWYDDDLVSLRVTASNGRFTATTDLYEDHGVFRRVAEALEGFPKAEGDSREFEVGTFDPNYAGGGAKARFRTMDAAGHALADLSIASKDLVLGDGFVGESASFVVPVLAAAVDEFVRDMRGMDLAVGASATLAPSE